MPLTSMTCFNQRRVASYSYLQWNKKRSLPLLMTNYTKAISDLPNWNKCSQSFSFQRKIGKSRWCRIISTLMNAQWRTITHCHLHISQLIDKLKGTKLFTKMDLRWGYNNIHIKEGDKWKATFVCFRGAYEPLVVYFGLCNSPATFQTIMNEIFVADMEDVMVVYIDDLMIFTKTDNQKKHDRIVLEVLCRLEENDLFVKPEQCIFKATKVKFLGMTMRQKVLRWTSPKCPQFWNGQLWRMSVE